MSLLGEDVIEALPARLGWPFVAEHDLWFFRALHAPRLQARLAALQGKTGPASAAERGRLLRLLGDDAGARRELETAQRLPRARAWLAELDLGEPGAEELLSSALEFPQARLYRAAARLLARKPKAALADAVAYRGLRPRSALGALLEGEAWYRAGNRRRAAAAFAAAGRLDPTLAAAALLGARADSGGLPAVLSPRAARLAESALDRDPTYALITLSWHGPRARAGAPWRRHLARLLRFALEEPERAGWYYRQDDIHYAPYHFKEYADARALLALRPDAPWALALTARGALRCPPDEALAAEGLALARRAAARAPRLGWPRAWVALGLIKARRAAEAERLLTDCLRLQPLYHRAIAWRGALRRGMGKTEEALADLDRAIAVDELYPFAAHERSLARRQAGDWAGAALDLDRAFALDFRYAWCFFSGREPDDATMARGEKELSEAIEREPSCVSLRAWRGEHRRVRRDLPGALADLYDAAALDPGHANALAFLGRALLDAGRAREAAATLARAVSLAPARWIFHGWLAEAQFRAGRARDAYARIEAIRAGTPAHWWALHLRARLLLEQGRPGPALAAIEQADAFEGRHAEGHFLAAQARLALNELEEAEAEIDKALRVSPHLGRALLLRAELRRRQGRAADAVADWRTVLQKFPYLLNVEERAQVQELVG